MPAMPPMLITVPIRPLCQPWAIRNTPRNGPIPACMSAMKKFSARNGSKARRVAPFGKKSGMQNPRQETTG